MRRACRFIDKVQIENSAKSLCLDSKAITEIDSLLRSGIGDTGRLNHIKSMLEDGRTLYNSDRMYLEALRSKVADSKIGHDDKFKDAAYKMSEEVVAPKEDSSDEVAPKEDSSEEVVVAKEDRSEETIHVKPPKTGIPDAKGDRNIVIINQPRQSSAAWYLLPIFFAIIGGAISYACLRRQDPSRARKTLILGTILSVIPILLLVVIAVFLYEEFGDAGGPVIDMSDDQIRQSALVVPYESLMEESQRYEGEIIMYEGDIVQTVDNFHSYVLRVKVSNELLESNAIWSNFSWNRWPGPAAFIWESNSIWSNFSPTTEEERQWLSDLEHTNSPFDQDPDRVRIWGSFIGLREYDTLFGVKMTVPEVYVHILERIDP